MSDATRLIALNLGVTLAGGAALVVAGIPVRRGCIATLVGLAPLTGLALGGLAASLAAMSGVGVGIATTVAVVLVALGAGRLLTRNLPSGADAIAPVRQGSLLRVAELAFVVLLLALGARVVALAAASDLGWDGWAVWATKAHALYVEGDVWGPVFAAPEYLMHHPQYPVLLPSLEALSASAIGRFDPNLIDIEPAVVLPAFGLAVWAVLRLVLLPAAAAAIAVALTGSPHLYVNATENYADAVVAAFVAAGLLCLFVWLTRGSTPLLVLAGLFLAAGATTKTEGLVFAIAAVVAALVVARGFERQRRAVLGLGAAVLALPVVWIVVDHVNGPSPRIFDVSMLLDPGYVADEADRIPIATARLVAEIGDGWPLLAAAIALGLLAAACARLWWPLLFVAIWGSLTIGALVAVYLATTLPFDWHLETSVDRIVFSIVLGLASVASVLVAEAYERAVVGPVSRLRQPGTRPTASSDWPNGGS
jgi:hypothetical protein